MNRIIFLWTQYFETNILKKSDFELVELKTEKNEIDNINFSKNPLLPVQRLLASVLCRCYR